MRLSRHELMEVLGWLGFTAQDFSAATAGTASVEDARQRLEELKRRIRKAGRRLYRELHPDLNDGPGAERRLRRMKRLTDALEALEHLDVQPRPRLVAVVQADSTSTTEPFDGFSRTSFDGFTG